MKTMHKTGRKDKKSRPGRFSSKQWKKAFETTWADDEEAMQRLAKL